MRKLNTLELELVSGGGGFWKGFCSGFTLGTAGFLLVGITTGPLGAAIYTSVGVGCALNTIVRHVSDKAVRQY